WGNGSSFDNVILRNFYERANYRVPWRWYADRDVRTIVQLGRDIGYDPKTDMPFTGERHNALDDAIHQAQYVSAIYQKLMGNHEFITN
ncbi:3'-5' exonuclease, partial [Xenorhabdus bovienii]